MTTATKQASVVQTVESFLRQVDAQTKTAATPRSEPGDYEGATSHPVKNVDDRLEAAPEGFRSSENTKDVKEQEGAIGVDSASESINKGQDEQNINIGTHQSATGEDSKVETGSAKPGKEDGGTRNGKTSHPARTDNDSLDGSKYSAARNVLDLVKKAHEPGQTLIARIAAEAHGAIQQKAATVAQAQGVKPEAIEAAKTAATQAQQAGTELANMAVFQDKQAQDATVVEKLAFTIQDGRRMAEKVAEYVTALAQGVKQAEEPEDTSDKPKDKGDDSSDPSEGSSPDDAAGAMGPGGGGGDDDALIQALLGGGDGGQGGGADAAAMGGGASDAGPMGGGDQGGMPGMAGGAPGGDAGGGMPGAPMGDMGGAPGAGGPPGAGGGMGGDIDPQQLQMLAQALQEAGITPEQLEQAVAAKAASAIRERQKQAASKTSWRPKNAQEAQQYQATLNYIRELTGR